MSRMTREQLEQLSKDELIDIILRQQTYIERLETRVAQLEARVERLTGPPKDHTNSSVPPSQSRQVGSGQVVEIPPVRPVVIEARLYEITCPVCGESHRGDYPPG